jgi:hypothetical protein
MDGGVRKRKAEESLSNERLSKRLESLNLGEFRCYLLAQEVQLLTIAADDPDSIQHVNLLEPPSNIASIPETRRVTTIPPSTIPQVPPIDEEFMEVEDTKDRVFITNLDKEIAEIEAAEREQNKIIFLPDVEQQLTKSRIPLSVLANKAGELAGLSQSQALMLYDVPHSLSVPEGKDSVRKAILESRHRAQEEQRRKVAREIGKVSRKEDTPVPLASAAIVGPDARQEVEEVDMDDDEPMEDDVDVMDMD